MVQVKILTWITWLYWKKKVRAVVENQVLMLLLMTKYNDIREVKLLNIFRIRILTLLNIFRIRILTLVASNYVLKTKCMHWIGKSKFKKKNCFLSKYWWAQNLILGTQKNWSEFLHELNEGNWKRPECTQALFPNLWFI